MEKIKVKTNIGSRLSSHTCKRILSGSF